MISGLVLKASQLGLFGAPRDEVQQPGVKGGKFYRTKTGKVRYGDQPTPRDRRTFEFRDPAEVVLRRVQVAELRDGSGFFAGTPVRNPGDVARIFHDVTDLDRERLWCVHMNRRGQVAAIECVSQGWVSGSPVFAREAFKAALAMGTAAVAFVHNHPSGVPGPSNEDHTVSRHLVDVGKDIGVEVRHCVVVARDGWESIFDGDTGDWSAAAARDSERRELPDVVGRTREPGQGGIDLPVDLARPIPGKLQNTIDLLRLAESLLAPEDATALAVMCDIKHQVTGVFRIASGTFDSQAVNRSLTRLGIGQGASTIFLVAGEDGADWQEAVKRHARVTVGYKPVGVDAPIIDAIIAGGPRAWSALAERQETTKCRLVLVAKNQLDHKPKGVWGVSMMSVRDPATRRNVTKAVQGSQLRDLYRERERLSTELFYLTDEDIPSASPAMRAMLDRARIDLQRRKLELDAQIDRLNSQGRTAA